MVQIGGSASQKRQQIFDFFIFFTKMCLFLIFFPYVEKFISSWNFSFLDIMCGSNLWLTIPPPREWVGTSQVFRAQPRGYHWIFVPDPRGYHWIFVPDPRNITDFSSEKVICPGGMVNHRFEPHIRRPAGRTRNFDFLVAVFGIFKENRGMFLCNTLRPT